MRLKIAIQKKGRLYEDTIFMFKNAGFRFTKDSTGFIMPCENADFDLILLRDDDIPTVVAQKGCDLGIVGRNTIHEDICEEKYHNKGVSSIESGTVILQDLPFGKCRLSIAGGKTLAVSNLANKSVATSYPYSLLHFAKDIAGINTIILKGSVEIAPKLGIADAICDLVSSGMTLKENELVEGETILHSNAVLIGNDNFDVQNKIYKRIIDAIAEPASPNMKYIMFNCEATNMPKILDIISFSKSPTVLPLAQSGMNAVHVMCKEDDFWEVHKKLKDAGATSILVMSVEKVM